MPRGASRALHLLDAPRPHTSPISPIRTLRREAERARNAWQSPRAGQSRGARRAPHSAGVIRGGGSSAAVSGPDTLAPITKTKSSGVSSTSSKEHRTTPATASSPPETRVERLARSRRGRRGLGSPGRRPPARKRVKRGTCGIAGGLVARRRRRSRPLSRRSAASPASSLGTAQNVGGVVLVRLAEDASVVSGPFWQLRLTSGGGDRDSFPLSLSIVIGAGFGVQKHYPTRYVVPVGIAEPAAAVKADAEPLPP